MIDDERDWQAVLQEWFPEADVRVERETALPRDVYEVWWQSNLHLTLVKTEQSKYLQVFIDSTSSEDSGIWARTVFEDRVDRDWLVQSVDQFATMRTAHRRTVADAAHQLSKAWGDGWHDATFSTWSDESGPEPRFRLKDLKVFQTVEIVKEGEDWVSRIIESGQVIWSTTSKSLEEVIEPLRVEMIQRLTHDLDQVWVS